MAKWAYVATPSGAPLGKTLELAQGRAQCFGDGRGGTGLIHRRLHGDNKAEIPFVRDLRVGDEIVLMYNLFHVGLVYPVAFFELLRPRNYMFPAIEPQGSVRGLGRLTNDKDIRDLAPDYLGNVDPVDRCNYVLKVLPVDGGLPASIVGKVWVRADGSDHALLPYDGLIWIEEEEGVSALDKLVPQGECADAAQAELANDLGNVWQHLDGRSRQLLITSRLLQQHGSSDEFVKYTVAAYPLCGLAEYELAKRLKSAGDDLLRQGKSTKHDLPQVPELTLRDGGLEKQIVVLQTLLWDAELVSSLRLQQTATLIDDLHLIRKARNRVAHSYLIEKPHFDELWSALKRFLEAIHYR